MVVPLMIHLLCRRPARQVAWAAMRFLQASVARHRRRLRIEEGLLLLVRCLLLGALALALARPVTRGAWRTAWQPVVAVLLLDHSASMSHTDGVESRFDRARQAAEDFVAAMPVGSRAALWLVADTVTALVPEPTADRDLLRKMIREAPLTDRASNLLPGFQQAVAALERQTADRREIHCWTDRTALAWRQSEEIRQLLAPRRAVIHTRVRLVGDADVENLAVTGLRLASGLAAAEPLSRCVVEVTNFGREPRRCVPVRIRVDDQPPADEAVLELIPPGGTQTVSLFAKLRKTGYPAVTAQLPSDRLPADDAWTMVVAARDRFEVLLVDGALERPPQEQAAWFLQQALQPVAPQERTSFFVQVTTVAPSELADVQWESFDAVLLADVPELPTVAVPAVEQYLRRGGGVVVFTGPWTRPEFYNNVVQEWLPARLGEVRQASPEQWFGWAAAPYDHPVLALWNDPVAGTLASARFYQAYELMPHESARVVARFANGEPAVVERAWGAGRVMLFASTANTAWNDLPVRPAFVPLLFRTLGWLVQEQTDRLNVTVGQKFVYRARDEQVGANVTVEPPPAGATARSLSRVEVVARQPSLQFERTDWRGTYRVRIESEPPSELAFGVQPDPAESDLTPLPVAEEQALATVMEFESVEGTSNGPTVVRAAAGEWWWFGVLTALLLAVTEMGLGHWFSKAK